MHQEINDLFQEMQAASNNCAGVYHFSKLDLPIGKDLSDSFRKFLLRLERYKNPFVITEGKKHFINNLKVKNLILQPVSNHQAEIMKKLHYWIEHERTTDGLNDPTTIYYDKEKGFKTALFNFLNSLTHLKCYLLQGIDTSYAHDLGGDHVSDDMIFESEEGVFVLHFGWSS